MLDSESIGLCDELIGKNILDYETGRILPFIRMLLIHRVLPGFSGHRFYAMLFSAHEACLGFEFRMESKCIPLHR